MAGDSRSGVSIMKMDRGLDTGPVYLVRECEIAADATGPKLEAELADLGCQALLECLDRLPGITPVAQPATGACYAKKLTVADAPIDWARPAAELDRQIRALCGRMPAITFAGTVRLQILEAVPHGDRLPGDPPGTVLSTHRNNGITVACGSGTLSITRLRLNRGKGLPQSAAQALNGFPELLSAGCVFHADPA